MLAIYYNSINKKTGQRLQKTLESDVSEQKIEIYQTIDDLSERLRQSALGNIIIVVLLIDTIAEIYQIYSIRRLNYIRIITVIPDRSSEILSTCFKLYPRFISYFNSDFKDVSLVLRKMIKITDKSPAFTD